jgi:hypothetical protein
MRPLGALRPKPCGGEPGRPANHPNGGIASSQHPDEAVGVLDDDHVGVLS